MSREYIANALKRLRESSGLTASQVGELIGKSGKTVNAWENNRGQPDAEILIKLCDIYNVDNILAEFDPTATQNESSLSEHERKIIFAYRNKPDVRPYIDKLLDVNDDSIDLSQRDIDSQKSDVSELAIRISQMIENGEIHPDGAKIAAFGGNDGTSNSSDVIKHLAELINAVDMVRKIENNNDK